MSASIQKLATALDGASPAGRRKLLANGYDPIPIAGKAPKWAWRKAEPITGELLSEIEADHPDHLGTGLRTGRLCVVDVDLTESDHAEAASDAITAAMGESLAVRIGSKGQALCFFNPEPIGKVTVSGCAPGEKEPARLIEFLGRGQQVAAYGTHPSTNKPYEWPNDFLEGDPLGTPLESLPQVSPAMIRKAADAVAARLEALGFSGVSISEAGTEAAQEPSAAKGAPVSAVMLEDMLAHVEPSCDRNEWLAIAGAIKSANVVDPDTGEPDSDFDGAELFEKWSSGVLQGDEKPPANYQGEADCAKDYATIKNDKRGGANLGSLIFQARKGGYDGPTQLGVAMFGDLANDNFDSIPESPEPRAKDASRWARLAHSGSAIFTNIKPAETVISEWLPAQGFTALLAKRGTGKTLAMLDMALSIASDMDWCGQPTKEGFWAVMLVGEDIGNSAAHVEAWCQKHGLSKPPKRFLFIEDVPDLMSAEDSEALAQYLRSVLPDGARAVLFVDTWQRASARGGQNRDEDMQKAVGHAEAIARSLNGPCVIAFHPPKHDGGTVMGSSVIENATSAIWELSDDAGTKRLTVTRIKGKGTGNYQRFAIEDMGLGRTEEHGGEVTGAVMARVGGVEVESSLRDAERRAYADLIREAMDASMREGEAPPTWTPQETAKRIAGLPMSIDGRKTRAKSSDRLKRHLSDLFRLPVSLDDEYELALIDTGQRRGAGTLKVFQVQKIAIGAKTVEAG